MTYSLSVMRNYIKCWYMFMFLKQFTVSEWYRMHYDTWWTSLSVTVIPHGLFLPMSYAVTLWLYKYRCGWLWGWWARFPGIPEPSWWTVITDRHHVSKEEYRCGPQTGNVLFCMVNCDCVIFFFWRQSLYASAFRCWRHNVLGLFFIYFLFWRQTCWLNASLQ